MTVTSRRDQAISAAAVAAVHAGLLWLVLHDRPSKGMVHVEPALTSFTIAAPHSPPPRAPRRATRRSGASGPAGTTGTRSAVVVPLPIIVPPLTQQAPVLPDLGEAPLGGVSASSDGTGSGQNRGGSGSGGVGSGDGARGGTRARWLSGAITPRDYPSSAREQAIEGEVTVAFVVGTDGRARDCTVTRSSGSEVLDSGTCRLIERRFRYAPARDAAGTPISERRGWRQRWWIE